MVIKTVSALALYCPRCGKLHMHTVSRFDLNNKTPRELLCRCGQLQATIASGGGRQFLLDVSCVLCQSNHIVCLDSKRLWLAGMDKICCVHENFELGFYGEWQLVQDTINSYKVEIERLTLDMGMDECDDYVQNPQVMLDTLNKIHDLAEHNRVTCRCGSSAIGAEVLPDGVSLECAQCGGHLIIPARDEVDLTNFDRATDLEIISPRRSRRKH